MNTLNINEDRYIVKRRFKQDGWFGKMLENNTGEEMAGLYNAEKVFKASDGWIYLVDLVVNAEIIEDIIPTTDTTLIESNEIIENNETTNDIQTDELQQDTGVDN